jgi:hypothetical protein
MVKTYIITKKIAKHGKQAILVIPSFLQKMLKPNALVEVQLKVLED